jgi:putative transcriptional regulator
MDNVSGKIVSDISFNYKFNKPDIGNYYDGQLLIATPYMRGDFFAGAVIYIFAHNAGGAMGVIINKPLEMVHHVSLFQQLAIDMSGYDDDLTLYHGGPVEENRGFVLHSADYCLEDTLTSSNRISVTASVSILKDVARGKGPEKLLIAIGCAGWSAGQLESEIESNSWITVSATPEIIFHKSDAAKYGLTEQLLGFDMMRFAPEAGHA